MIRRRSVIGFALLAAFLGGLSLAGFLVARQGARDQANEEFSRLATDLTKVLREGFDADVGTVESVRGFYDAEARQGIGPLDVEPEAFRTFAKRLARRSDFRALGFNPRVPRPRLGQFLGLAKQRVSPTFRVYEKDRSGRDRPISTRSSYYPVYTIDPPTGNTVALGFDVASEPNRRRTLAESIAAGAARATARIALVQEDPKRGAVLVFAPVFRGGLEPRTPRSRRSRVVGVAVGVMVIDDTVRLLADRRQFDPLNYAVYQEPGRSTSSLLYSSAGPTPKPAASAIKQSIPVAGRRWTLVAWPRPGRLEPAYGVSWLLLVSGLAISALLLTIMIRQAHSKERLLRLQNIRLEQANLKLREQTLHAEQASRAKSDFLSHMSHELRTPLTSIIGFSEIMVDGDAGETGTEERKFLGIVLKNARHLLDLINDLLDLSKVEAGKLELRPERVELPALVDELTTSLRVLADEKKIRLESRVSPGLERLVLDRGRLKQVIYNYLSNALKFTREGGQVTLRAEPEGDDRFRLSVEDTGIGIALADQKRLFQEFMQLEQSEERQGTGLGLALVKRLVEAQGGEVGVHSAPGKGSVFYAVLPRFAGGVELGQPDGNHAEHAAPAFVGK